MKKLILLFTLGLCSSVSWAEHTAQQYAQWIVDNEDLKGTPDFNTVAKAYRAARAREQEERLFSYFAGPSEEQQEEQEAAVDAAQAIEAEELAFTKDRKDTNAPSVGLSRGFYAAEEEQDANGQLLLIILLFGIAAVFLMVKILRPNKDAEGAGVATRFIGGTGGYTIKIVLSLIFFIFLWAPFLSPIFTDAIRESHYVVYGGEGEAFLASVLQSAIWIAGMAPLLWFWNKKRKASHVAASSSTSEAQSTQGSKSSDELQPLKMIQAAQIADEVSTAADIDSVIQVASILSSEKEIMKAVQEANEDLRDAYETKVKDLFEKQGIDRKSLTAKAIESEVNRCMKLGLNKICLDERLVPILGSQEIGK